MSSDARRRANVQYALRRGATPMEAAQYAEDQDWLDMYGDDDTGAATRRARVLAMMRRRVVS